MRFANLEIVKLLKPRLGFGSATESQDVPSLHEIPEPNDEPAPPISEQDLPSVDDTPLSLLLLADELESALKAAPAGARKRASASLREVATLFNTAEAETAHAKPSPAPEPPPIPAANSRQLKGLEGCKVGAIGFGRQDIAGLAAAMMERRARIEFLPRGEIAPLREFDLLLINAASVELLKRDADHLRDILAQGVPSIIVGTRSVINVLRESTDPFTWDFLPKPLHVEELAWRAAGLLTRQEGSSVTRKLPARVVVADSDPFTRALVDSAMTQLGVQCELAEEGEKAIDLIEESKPGAVILDLTLPNRDGFQILADIRRMAGRKPKLIVLSARQTEADVLRAFSLGADDYITKPFSPLELSARLTRLLGGLPEHG